MESASAARALAKLTLTTEIVNFSNNPATAEFPPSQPNSNEPVPTHNSAADRVQGASQPKGERVVTAPLRMCKTDKSMFHLRTMERQGKAC